MTPIQEDLIITALEGGSNYWYRIESNVFGFIPTALKDGDTLKISNYHILPEDKPREGKLNTRSLAKGLQIMKNKYPRHYEDALAENGDAATADVYLQCCIFGEVIYG